MYYIWVWIAATICGLSADLLAVDVTVNGSVAAVNAIAFSGNPATFNVSPGNSPRVNASTTYSLTTNQTSQKITAKIGSTLPSGVTLTVNLTAPTGGTSAGSVALSTTNVNLVTAITRVVQANIGVSYAVSTTPTAVVTTGIIATITYTLSS